MDQARALLREAGYPDGFRITLHSANGSFASDTDVAQAIAQGWTRPGIETRVEVLPPANLLTCATALEFSMFMTTYPSSIAANTLRQVLMTRDTETGVVPFKCQHYSNPAIDAPLAEALRTMGPARRSALTAQAIRIGIEDGGVIPILYLKVSCAGLGKKVKYVPRLPGTPMRCWRARPERSMRHRQGKE